MENLKSLTYTVSVNEQRKQRSETNWVSPDERNPKMVHVTAISLPYNDFVRGSLKQSPIIFTGGGILAPTSVFSSIMKILNVILLFHLRRKDFVYMFFFSTMYPDERQKLACTTRNTLFLSIGTA